MKKIITQISSGLLHKIFYNIYSHQIHDKSFIHIHSKSRMAHRHQKWFALLIGVKGLPNHPGLSTDESYIVIHMECLPYGLYIFTFYKLKLKISITVVAYKPGFIQPQFIFLPQDNAYSFYGQ